jgi:hypothetical protein
VWRIEKHRWGAKDETLRSFAKAFGVPTEEIRRADDTDEEPLPVARKAAA